MNIYSSIDLEILEMKSCASLLTPHGGPASMERRKKLITFGIDNIYSNKNNTPALFFKNNYHKIILTHEWKRFSLAH